MCCDEGRSPRGSVRSCDSHRNHSRNRSRNVDAHRRHSRAVTGTPARIHAVGDASGAASEGKIAGGAPPPAPPNYPPAELMDQRASFSRRWARLPAHMKDVCFDLHGTVWSPASIHRQSGRCLCNYVDVFSTLSTDLGACTVMPFTHLVPSGTKLVVTSLCRIVLLFSQTGQRYQRKRVYLSYLVLSGG